MKEEKGWNPYLAGGLSGLVSIGSVWFAGKYLGASTTFVRATAALEQAVMPERAATLEYLVKTAPKMDWQAWFLVGIFIGSLTAAALFGDFKFELVPPMWKKRFGDGVLKRGVVAFIGGGVAMFGARLADGCPSGHGLSGSLQLAVSGIVALAAFFIAGAVTAKLVYGGGERNGGSES
ncbi:MAG: YeeE/YedE family protein [Synergistetes bacterium HGW-Synergistetes-2]|nr:MAG: YeeE/YedE family protein [Synergistetes bacterium HGW-Synergistetes-2]